MPMEPLNITITDLGLDTIIGVGYRDEPVTLVDAIVKEAVSQLTKEKGYDEVRDGVRKRVALIRDEEIRALVRPELEKAMVAPITQTNSWGEPIVGKPTTLREMILAEATKFFTEKKGEDSYGRGPKQTAAERVVAELVRTELVKEMTAAFAEEKNKVVAAVQAKAAEMIAKAVKDGLR